MATIGINGAPFSVDKSYKTALVSQTGNLFLGYADVNYANNSGSLDVNVTVVVPPGRRVLNLAR